MFYKNIFKCTNYKQIALYITNIFTKNIVCFEVNVRSNVTKSLVMPSSKINKET